MRMHLLACAVVIVTSGCDADAPAQSPPERAPVALPAEQGQVGGGDLLAQFDLTTAKVDKGRMASVGGEAQYTLEKGGRVKILPIPAAIAPGDQYEAIVTLTAVEPGSAALLLGQACGGTVEQSIQRSEIVSGVNELKVTHTFNHTQKCARLIIGAGGADGLTLELKSVSLQKK